MISHQHKCIFVHVPKCGGQSIEHMFLGDLGLTWETRGPLLLRPNEYSGLGPPRLAHLTALEYVKYHYVSRELFEQYYKFSVVRNPFDRVKSLYRYLGYSDAVTFNQFVCRHLVDIVENKTEQYWFVRPQAEFIYDEEDRLLVDGVFKLERLDQDVTALFARVFLRDQTIPHVNKSSDSLPSTRFTNRIRLLRRGVYSWRMRVRSETVYTCKEVAVVSKLFSRDFALLGYSPSQPAPLKRP